MAKLIKSNGEITEVKPENHFKFTLAEMQKYVGGLIEKYRAGGKVFIWNENAIGKKLPINQKATDTLYIECDGLNRVQTILGDVLLCEPNECSGNITELN